MSGIIMDNSNNSVWHDNVGIFFTATRRQKRSITSLNEYFDNKLAGKKNKLGTNIEFLEMPLYFESI